ncbi:hypothetical protein OH77DRAFT_1419034 [Trametes cingulata]|nr:hypothetical protein OH77DRAFT_1419034 [Trametes cingulata]
MQLLSLAHAVRRASRLDATRCSGWRRTALTVSSYVRGMSQSSPPEAPKKRRNPMPNYDGESIVVPWTVRSLQRRNLTPQDYVDLSNARALAIDPSAEVNAKPEDREPLPPFITYGFRKPFTFTPFPINTRGFFYYWHRPRALLGGSIRFRVMQEADPHRFAHGYDLLNEYGTPWEMSLLALSHLRRYASLWDALRRDKIHSFELLKRSTALLSSAHDLDIRFEDQLIRSAGQPFYVDLTQPRQKLHLLGNRILHLVRAHQLFLAPTPPDLQHEKMRALQRWPFAAGRLRCQFELIEPWIDDPAPSLVLRVLRIIEPVRMVPVRKPNVLAVDPRFEPGALLTASGSSEPVILGPDHIYNGDELKWAFVHRYRGDFQSIKHMLSRNRQKHRNDAD